MHSRHIKQGCIRFDLHERVSLFVALCSLNLLLSIHPVGIPLDDEGIDG